MYPIDLPFLGFAPSHRPVVAAHIGGLETRMLVDTGASETLLTADFAAQLGLDLAPAEPGTDHGLHAVPSWTTREAIPLTLCAATFPLDHVPVIAAPASFSAAGIGGILSPQRLAPAATLSLDFGEGRMRLGGAIATADGLVATELVPLHLAGDEAWLLVAEGSELPGGAMFNSGTRRCEVAPGLFPGSAPARPSGHGLSGHPVAAAPAGRHRFTLGPLRLPATAWLASPQPAGIAMQIGMELLAGTQLDVSIGQDLLRWWTPAAWLRPG